MKISNHAIERFRERSGTKKNDKEIARKLCYFLTKAKEVELKKHYGVIALLNHDFKPAKYYNYNGWILVVEDDELKTIHMGEAGRWS